MAADPVIRVFISSPGDVRAERRRAALVCNRLSREFGRFFAVRPVLWEYEPMLAAGHFQDVIEPAPSDADIVAVILWSRLGTPLPEETERRRYEGLDGRAPVTGTEWEFEDALRARQERKARGEPAQPDLLVYRSNAVPEARALRGDGMRQAGDQLDALEAFWQRHFETADGGFKLAYATYDTADAFEERFEADLRGLLRRRLPEITAPRGTTAPDAAIAWHQGSPFRGLQAFDVEHSAIFFGRAEDQRKVIDALAERAGAGTAFVLVLGASGTGKSSLARAGVAPDLTVPGVVGRVEAWRRAVLRPAADGEAGDLFARVADALAEAVPELEAELARMGPDAGNLADRLRDGSARDLLRAALYRAAEDGGLTVLPGELPPIRLLVIVDQLEELFTAEEEITPDAREAFVELLRMLATSGVAWVLATMRSDFYGRLADLPALRDLAAGNGQYLLAPPSGAQLRQMIELPAAAAGLDYEEEEASGISLAAGLLEEAQGPGALPLLEFALGELYARDIAGKGGNTTLSFASYRAMGGLRGALAHQAEAAVAALGPAYDEALRSVLLALVTQRQDDAPTARTARKVELASTPERARVVEALITARLLVGGGNESDTSVRLAHEALLTSWPRYGELIAVERDFLRARDRAAARAALWQSEGEPGGRLMDGIDLAEGQQILRDRRADLSPMVVRFVESSLAAAEARRAAELAAERKKRRIYQVLGGIAAALAIAAMIGGWSAYQNQQEAEREARAVRAAGLLATARSETDPLTATLILAEAQGLPVPLGGDDFALELAGRAVPQAILDSGGSEVRTAVFSTDSRRVLTLGNDGIARISTADGTGSPEILQRSDSALESAVFGPDGKRVLTVSKDGAAHIWSADGTGPPVILRFLLGNVSKVIFSPKGTHVLTVSREGTVRIHVADGDDKPGKLLQDGGISGVKFSPNGKRVLMILADGTVLVRPVYVGGVDFVTVAVSGLKIEKAVFSPDGKQLLTVEKDGVARLWDLSANGPAKELEVLEGKIASAVFSPDGKHVLTATKNQADILWNFGSNRRSTINLEGHEGIVTSAVFSPDGKRVLTTSEDGTARVWLWSTKQGQVADHRILRGAIKRIFQDTRAVAGTIESSAGWFERKINFRTGAFSPDGRNVLTVSEDGVAQVWAATNRSEPVILSEDLDKVLLATFSLDSKRVLIVLPGTARVWAVDSGDALAEIKDDIASGGGVNIVLSPNGGRLLHVSMDGKAKLWSTDGANPPTVLKHFKGTMTSAAFSPDGERMLTVYKDGTVQTWSSDGKGEATVVRGPGDMVSASAFSPDGSRVLIVSKDGVAQIEAADGSGEYVSVKTGGWWVTRVTFSPDGRRVLALIPSWSGTNSEVWMADGSGEPASLDHAGNYLAGDNRWVKSYVFSPDGEHVVSASDDGVARVWSAVSGGTVGFGGRGGGGLMHAIFSPDSKRVLTVASDGSTRVWDTDRGSALIVTEGDEETVQTAIFSPDGKQLLTVSQDGIARTWPQPPLLWQDLLVYLRERTTACLTVDQRRRYLAEKPSKASLDFNACERRFKRGL